MANKVLLIGIDSLEPSLLEKYGDNLPNFSKLRENNNFHLESVFPVDSIPAWASIYTGLNPSQHGIVKTFDVFDSDLSDTLNFNGNILQGNTFWDYAGKSGKRVCVLFPLLAFPPWKVNGIMVSRAIPEIKITNQPEWIAGKEILTYPSSVAEKYDIPRILSGISGKHPGNKNLKKWSDQGKKVLQYEADLGLKICKEEDWDMFFIYFSWLDIIQHRLWRFCDENDPSHPVDNPFKDILKDFYILMDKIVGDFQTLCPKIPTLIFSDHGHQSRPLRVVNVNKVLNEQKLLLPQNTKFNCNRFIMEKLKIELLNFVNYYELDSWLVNLSTKTKALSSLSKDVYTSTSSNQRNSNIAQLSTFAGVKSYSHGGIEINTQNIVNIKDYEEIRTKILKVLIELKHPESGERLVEWACKREDLYEGLQVSKVYPDIVFELKEGYGTGWNIYSSLISKAYDHNLASGGHKKYSVFLTQNWPRDLEKNLKLTDIKNIVLDLLK